MLGGMKITTSQYMTERIQRSRSPSRAARRARLGYPQHFITRPMQQAYKLPDGTLVMHPETYEAFRRMVAGKISAAGGAT